MIEGVVIKKLAVHQDIPDVKGTTGDGVLMEVLRNDDGLLKKFGQSVCTIANRKGTIKAFHWHKKQDDLWFVATGKAKIVLHDLRPNSATHGQTEVLYAGVDDYKVILIPTGVAHGYKVLSDEPVLLFYHVTETYNPKDPDELRIPYDDPQIHFDWSAA